ncbi:uncharacterized protein DUF4249 [Anseongella ginsenosidimutans]|uniref:Uncharacterized protein DUF4249 n=1 Tax=Anseongella ginsenosidimutans TaxID=496056 RepID=A0A4R3KN16_9SPHI|nr:DUF4249 domain-containing protein [Anseongella ginsenosidimutans]QEC52433.1 DUF4249 domain-containing protein [Anseongella ginsenosidimutans]TCS85817.1 uncharacterized protein DUF4249 [Anseongella ginsenosidimutans]
MFSTTIRSLNAGSRLFAALLLTLPAILLASCEKVIDLDLKGVEAKYVIEGTLTNEAGGCRVLISQTKDFDENNDFPGISGAVVSISSQGSEAPVLLTETEPGIYEASSFAGSSGTTYLLEVIIGGTTYTASSTMPEQVNMDTIYVTEENIFGENWKLANIEFPDPAGIENKYRYIQYINGEKTEGFYTRDDELVDGRTFETKLYMDPGTDEEDRIQSGDELTIEMQCIDADMYTYWFSLEQGATGDGSPATPANPVSNIRGGALGYFSAHTTQVKTMIAP